jgi:predicted ATP-dependent endonuclease of OLD family
MKLIGIRLKNFRSYKDITIDLSEKFNMLVGMNDIGKSTILEALEIFFNDSSKLCKIGKNDLSINTTEDDNIIEIACEFDIEPNMQIVIDATVNTTLEREYMLNENGNLEIIKEWDATKKTFANGGHNSYIRCNYPSIGVRPIEMKLPVLKTTLRGVDADAEALLQDARVASQYREAIYNRLVLDDTENENLKISTKKLLGDNKDIYTRLRESLPVYFLFKSDRANSSSDSEVQNPLSVATKDVLNTNEIKTQLALIEQQVKTQLEAINDRTIEYMCRFNPSFTDQLKSEIVSDWVKGIKNELFDNNGVEINKRGSGIRRLILLSYLMAEAERDATDRDHKDIIYAIEEPETSLHPKTQNQFINHLIEMTRDIDSGDELPENLESIRNYHIMITTHTPNFVAYAKPEQVVYIANNGQENEIITDEEMKVELIKNQLGLLPKVDFNIVLYVEGENDINFLKNINRIPELKTIIDLNSNDIVLIPAKGSNLVNIITKNHFEIFKIKEYHFYDSDVDRYVELVDQINEEGLKRRGQVTSLWEMENYIPPELIEIIFGMNIDQTIKDDWKNRDFDVAEYIFNNMATINHASIRGIRDSDRDHAKKIKSIKAVLNKTVMRSITKELLIAHDVYDELKELLENIRDFKNSTQN